MTFRSRLVLAAAGAVVVAILLASLAAYFATESSLVNSLDASLTNTLHALKVDNGSRVAITSLGSIYGDVGQFVTQGGQVVPQAVLPVDASVHAVASGDASPFFASLSVHGAPYRELVYPAVTPSFFGAGPLISGAVQIATPLGPVNHQLAVLRVVLALVAVGGIVLAVVLGWLVGRTALVPLNELTAAVEEVAQTTDVSRRLDAGGPDELGRLRRAFNRLLGALERSRESQRQLVLDAAHELRTPLTSLRTNMEVAKRLDELPPVDREVLAEDVITQMDELTDLVSGLTELARGEPRAEHRGPLRLDRLVDDCAALATVHGRSRNLRFDVTAEETWISAQRERVGRAVANLLDNAVKWSPDGGVVSVSCAEGTVVVRDQGPGIDEADLPHVFDRFFRSASARRLPGSGLGLAIVAQVAAEEDGEVEATNAVGGGAELRLRFPEVPVPGHPADD